MFSCVRIVARFVGRNANGVAGLKSIEFDTGLIFFWGEWFIFVVRTI